MTTKIKSYEERITKSFPSDQVPKEGSQYICLSVILIESDFETGKNYTPQVFLEECKYIFKGKKCLNILLKVYKFFLINLIKKILMKIILLKKVQMKILMRKSDMKE